MKHQPSPTKAWNNSFTDTSETLFERHKYPDPLPLSQLPINFKSPAALHFPKTLHPQFLGQTITTFTKPVAQDLKQGATSHLTRCASASRKTSSIASMFSSSSNHAPKRLKRMDTAKSASSPFQIPIMPLERPLKPNGTTSIKLPGATNRCRRTIMDAVILAGVVQGSRKRRISPRLG